MPIVKTAQAIKTMTSGQVLEVLATDAGAVKDFAAWSSRPATNSSSRRQDAGIYHFLIRQEVRATP